MQLISTRSGESPNCGGGGGRKESSDPISLTKWAESFELPVPPWLVVVFFGCGGKASLPRTRKGGKIDPFPSLLLLAQYKIGRGNFERILRHRQPGSICLTPPLLFGFQRRHVRCPNIWGTGGEGEEGILEGVEVVWQGHEFFWSPSP